MRIYGDTVELTFTEADHKYLVSHKIGENWTTPKPVTGVTTYCGALAKDFLAPWAAKLAAEYAIKNKGTQTNAKTLDEAKKQFKLAADAGARAGKLGHLYVEAKLKGKQVTMPTGAEDLKVVESVASAFEAFIEDWKPKFLEIEKVVYSKQYDYAGTCDFVAEIDGKLVIGDWKTTNTSRYNPDGIYASYLAQLGAYSLAYEEMTGKEPKELYIINLPKDGTEYKMKRLEDLSLKKTDLQAYFLSLKQSYELNQRFEWALGR